MRWAAALPGERDMPAGAADPLIRPNPGMSPNPCMSPNPFLSQGLGRCAGDPPAGERRRREAKRIHVRLAPAPQHQGRAASFLGGELEPAGRSHCQPSHLADHGGEAAVARALLHHRKHLLVIAAFGVEQAIGRQPGLSETGREQIAAGQRPEHLAGLPPGDGEARGEGGDEQGRGGLVIGRKRRRRDLVQPPGQSAARQPFVHFRYVERQARPPVSGETGAFDPAHLLPQGGEARIHDGRNVHATRTHMFALCSAASSAESSLAGFRRIPT